MRIKYRHLFKYYEILQPYLKLSLPVKEKIEGRKIFVISPHIDDDVFACGGTLYKHVLLKDVVISVAVCGKNVLRVSEDKEAMKILGFKKMYLEYEDDTLMQHFEIQEKLGKLILENSPDVICLPFMLDNHKDHFTINKFLMDVLKKTDVLIYAYYVWTPFYPNYLVDISEVMEMKIKAASCYKSQLKDRDYIDMITSINRYWGVVKCGKYRYLEPFLNFTSKNYVKLFNKLF